MSALHWAAFHNRPEHLRQLLDRGGDVEAVDVDGRTPLHWAAQVGNPVMMMMMMMMMMMRKRRSRRRRRCWKRRIIK